MRVLLIEDENKIANFLKRGLKENNFAVDVTKDGEEGLYFADINTYDLIILDLMLPKIDGLKICKQLREKKNNTPILILTARTELNDRIKGLNSGADDYLAKPFAFAELLARIRALLRRQRDDKNDVLKIDDLELNLLNHDVMRAGRNINLTSKEFALLEYMMLHAGEVITRTMISEHVWNEEFHSLSNLIDVHIRNLRKKVDTGPKKKLIHTLRGTGYILKDK
ncbi:MAG: DNA-binding response regulator [Omnitrophica WOR_2 bacterium GWA2_47_8]|nr:MAG: DNA-binding response regulator [Omnitrophica WOR_2 bacterium GWA2_47_8]